MLPREQPDRIQIAFDDHRLVASAGLMLPVTLAHHLGLGELVDSHVDLGDAPGRPNAGDKLLTLLASALAGGDCIDDADALRSGSTDSVLGCVVKVPSTLGTFLRSFRWGHVRQLDRVSREVMARAWSAGSGPAKCPLTIDLDSTVCETYGLAKEGAQRHNYAGKRGYHPLLAAAAGTGDVLMARLRQGRANTARGAAHFLRETVSRVRYAGATGPLTVRADSGFYNRTIVAACRVKGVRYSITVRQHPDSAIPSRPFPWRGGHPRLQTHPAVEPVEFREDSPPDPRRQLVDTRGGAQRRPVRHPGQSVGQLDQRIRRSGRLRWDQPAGGYVGQTVDARVVTVPVHHQACIVGHVATHVPPLDAAFVIARYGRLCQDRKCQTAGYHRSVAHRFTSLRMVPGVQLSKSRYPVAFYSSGCKSVSIPAALGLAFLETD